MSGSSSLVLAILALPVAGPGPLAAQDGARSATRPAPVVDALPAPVARVVERLAGERSPLRHVALTAVAERAEHGYLDTPLKKPDDPLSPDELLVPVARQFPWVDRYQLEMTLRGDDHAFIVRPIELSKETAAYAARAGVQRFLSLDGVRTTVYENARLVRIDRQPALIFRQGGVTATSRAEPDMLTPATVFRELSDDYVARPPIATDDEALLGRLAAQAEYERHVRVIGAGGDPVAPEDADRVIVEERVSYPSIGRNPQRQRTLTFSRMAGWHPVRIETPWGRQSRSVCHLTWVPLNVPGAAMEPAPIEIVMEQRHGDVLMRRELLLIDPASYVFAPEELAARLRIEIPMDAVVEELGPQVFRR